MVNLNLIRHGKTQWNLEKKIQGEKDIPLSLQGRSQVMGWSFFLKDSSLDLILSSPMARARETAEILGKNLGLEIVTDENIREQSFGLWEGRSIDEIRREFPEVVEEQERMGWNFSPPGGEARHEVLKRALGAMEAAGARFKDLNLLVVTHQGVINSLVYHALGRSFLPEEKRIIRDGHVHKFSWDQELILRKLNAIDLNQENP